MTLAADTYGYSLDPTHSNPVFWPLPRGGTVEVNVPVETAAAGAPKITGVVQLADGDLDPILEPSIVPIIDSTAQAASSDADAVSISYATPMITSQTVLNASTITVGFSGIVWNNSVTTVGNFADCQRRCSISWKVARRSALATISKATKPPVGTTFSFALNEAAAVTLSFSHSVEGRAVGGKCVAKTRQDAAKKHCAYTAVAGTLQFSGHSGTDTVAFDGRVSASTKLGVGGYTVDIAATNVAGQKATPALLHFTIVK